MAVGEHIGRAYVIILADGSGFADSVKEEIRKHEADFAKSGEKSAEAFHDGFDDEHKSRLSKMLRDFKSRLGRDGRGFEQAGNKIGRALGKGARNDFLNAFGTFATIGPRLFQGLINALGALGDKFKRTGEDAQNFKQVLANVAQQGLPGLVAAAAAVSFMITSLIGSLAPLASALVLVTGLVLALAGSLGFALVGGLVAAAGAMVPFAAAMGVGALAMAGLQKQAKSTNFKQLKEDWEDLQKATANEVFGKNQEGLKAVRDLLVLIRPVILAVAGALGQMVAQLGKVGQNKEFQNFLKSLEGTLPGMVTTLGSVLGNIGVFLGRAFTAATPIIEEFLGWLDTVTQKLADTGKGGEKSPLAKFFDDAWESAKIVGALILEIIGLVGDLFGAGKQTGDNIFTQVLNWVKDIRKWLADPANQTTIQKWFEDAQTLGEKLGGVVTAVGRFVAALDSPGSRKALFIIIDAVTGLIDLFADVATIVTGVGEDLGNAFSNVLFIIDNIKGDWATFWGSMNVKAEAFQAKIDAVWAGIVEGVDKAIQDIKDFFTGLWDWLVGNSLIPDLVDEIVRLFATLPGRIAGAIGNLVNVFVTWTKGVVGRAKALAFQIAKSFVNLARKVFVAAGSISSAFTTWVATLAAKAARTAIQIAAAFVGLAKKMIAKAGSISSAVTTWLSSLPGKARTIAGRIADAFSGLAKKAINKAGSLGSAISDWASGVYSRAKSVAENIAQAFRDVLSGFLSTIGLGSLNIPAGARKLLEKAGFLASGGVVFGPRHVVIGEAGPEAVVPLARPLSMVDPAVRELAAFAQGKLQAGNQGTDRSRKIQVGQISIVTPTEDPRAVASEVIARMAAASLF